MYSGVGRAVPVTCSDPIARSTITGALPAKRVAEVPGFFESLRGVEEYPAEFRFDRLLVHQLQPDIRSGRLTGEPC